MKKKNEEMMFLGIDGFNEIESLTPEASKKAAEAPKHKAPVDFKALAAKLGKSLRASKTKSHPAHSVGGKREHTVYKKRAVLAVGASVTAVMLSIVTVASALDGDPTKNNPPKKPAAAKAATPDEALKQQALGNAKGEAAALYIDGKQVGAASDSSKLQLALDKVLASVKEGHDDTTVTSFANKVEIKPYSGTDTTDADGSYTLMSGTSAAAGFVSAAAALAVEGLQKKLGLIKTENLSILPENLLKYSYERKFLLSRLRCAARFAF